MDGINGRIAQLIILSGLSKSDWARRLNVTPQYVSSVCLGKTRPSERTILDICQKFGASENWIKYGTGEPFVKKTRREEISAFVEEIIDCENKFRQRFVSALAALNESQWEMLERFVRDIVDLETDRSKKEQTANLSKPIEDMTDAEYDALKQQMDLERDLKRRTKTSLVLRPDGSKKMA